MTYKKKLIEVALPLAAISAESARQKTMGAAPHPQNLHRWWARRPLAATRAVLWASLVDDPSANPDRFPTTELQLAERQRLFGILERLVLWSASQDEQVLNEARREIELSSGGELPTILDPFGGGGAIPLESVRLGLPTMTGDLNPVAVLIQRAMIEIPGRFESRVPAHPRARAEKLSWGRLEALAADVEAYGNALIEDARKLIGAHFRATGPGRSNITPLAWIWARTVRSPDPAWDGEVPLVKSWELVRKPGKPTVWVDAVVRSADHKVGYEVRVGGRPPAGTVTRQGAVCLATGAPMPFSYIRSEAKAGRMGANLLAVVGEGPDGRVYLSPNDEDVEAADVARLTPISGELLGKATVNVGTYGFTDWSDIFTNRQLLALSTISELLKGVRERVIEDALAAGMSDDPARLRDGGGGAVAYADAIATYLAFAIDRCADNWSSICSWHVQNAQVKQTFALQAVPMTWDFAEVNPFSGRMASWESMLGGIVRAIPTLVPSDLGRTEQRDARARIAETGRCVVSTDPPYYDNISYADLSDFFYVWLRHNLVDVWPDECATLLTPKADELISSSSRAGSKALADAHFEQGIREVFAEAAANADDRYPTTIFYAFKASETSDAGVVSTGWETFLTGLLQAGFAVTATWPIRTETVIGIKTGKSMLASSVVLACRTRLVSAPMATRGEFISAMRAELEPAVRLLQIENIAPVDLAQSAIGPGIGIFSRYAKVVEADGSAMTVRTALGLINEILAEVLSGEESEFDADTRFALTWFEQYGHNPGPFGDADLLARAKDTTVAGVAQAGVVVNRDGKVRLVERADLPDTWDPATDARLTVWETTQYLIRALEASEMSAAELLRRMGEGLGERARQLAYLLYGVCDRKRWADEAGAFNMLVTAWPEIRRLASAESVDSTPEPLF